MMMSFAELQCLADLAQNKRVLEVGSHLGLSTIALASTAEKVYSVDWHRGDTQTTGWGFTLGKHVTNLIRYGVLDQVAVVCADGYDFARVLQDGFFDLVFLDADHRYEMVHKNISLYLPKVKPGGLLCFHDYGVTDPPCGEKQAVDKWFGGPSELVDTLAIIHVEG